MSPGLEELLREEAEVSITTYDSHGKPGAVPIWFAYEGGKVYVATGRDTLKVRRLQANPRVSLTFHRRKGAILEGTGHICAEEALVQRIAPILNRKYGGAWGSDAWFARRLLGEDIVLLEITPLS